MTKETKEELHVQERDIVVPGEILATGMGFLPSKGSYRKDEQIIADRVGLVSLDGKVIKLTPLCGAYFPKVGDVIVATVIDIMPNGWRVETNCPYSAVVTLAEATTEFISRSADLTRYFDIGDVIMTKIVNVTSQNLVDVTMKGPGLRKLFGGRLMKVDPQKVPRIIGKKASMVQMIKDATACKIAVGQNGVIWIDGTPAAELVAVNAIDQIVAKAHLSGLTDQIKAYLDKAAKDLPKPTAAEREAEEEQEEDQGFSGRGFDRGSSGRGFDRGFSREGRGFDRRPEGESRGYGRRFEERREGGFPERRFERREGEGQRFPERRFEGEEGSRPERRYEGARPRFESRREEGNFEHRAPRETEGPRPERRYEGEEQPPARKEAPAEEPTETAPAEKTTPKRKARRGK